MALEIDPEQNEVRALSRVAGWRNKRVLEIGCGDGRLSLRLARLGAIVHGIDADSALIRVARKNLPQRFAERIRYHVGEAEHLHYANESFDGVVFAWAL